MNDITSIIVFFNEENKEVSKYSKIKNKFTKIGSEKNTCTQSYILWKTDFPMFVYFLFLFFSIRCIKWDGTLFGANLSFLKYSIPISDQGIAFYCKSNIVSYFFQSKIHLDFTLHIDSDNAAHGYNQNSPCQRRKCLQPTQSFSKKGVFHNKISLL